MRNRIAILLLLCIATLGLNSGCSSERNLSISKIFHNTTSRYNGYYYARENIKAVEQKVLESLVNDYDEILPIFPQIDSSLANSYQTEIEEAIKMASLAIQRHPNSKWVDDSYLLIGLARYYSLDFVNAIQTFKYINTNSEDDNIRHLALIYLMRTFTDYGEYENAEAVNDFLKKEELNAHNQKLLNIYLAYYYQVKENLDRMLTNLVNAAPELRRKDGKGRMLFLIGQNYQALGFDPEAYNYYKQCLATNPEYELDFYARLNMAQVAQISKKSTVKDIRKDFVKLLTDKKNKEFKDKIYYEMAEFEMKQNELEQAIEYYDASIQNSVSNNKQKGISYLKLGRIYYDLKSNYLNAQAYYDSAVNTLPKTFNEYDKISQRHEILTNFIAQLNTIQLQDSLIQLSKLDSVTLNNTLTNIVTEELAEQKKEEKRKKEQEKRQQIASQNVFANSDANSTSSWYFGNQNAMAMGQNEFRRIWGDVKLEDHWRRSFKEQADGPIAANNTQGNSNSTQITEEVDENLIIKEKVAALRKEIPKTEEERLEALLLVEEAYYNLGKIYHFDLNEEENAGTSFKTLLNRFTTSRYKSEALYLLYLIYGNLNNQEEREKFKNELLRAFPNSTYSRLIKNPNYTEETSETAYELKLLYDSAYKFYIAGDLNQSRAISNMALRNYEEIQLSDRFKLLLLLITGKTEDIAQYQYELTEFMKNNPESQFYEYVKELLEASRSFQDKMLKAKGVQYIEFFEQEHYVIISYKPKRRITEPISKRIEEFNQEKYPDNALKNSNLILEDGHYLAMITEFKGAKSALVYYERLKADQVLKETLQGSQFEIFAITKDNFTLFYQTKALEDYLKFFKEHY